MLTCHKNAFIYSPLPYTGIIILTVQVMESSFAFIGTPLKLEGYLSGAVNKINNYINIKITH